MVLYFSIAVTIWRHIGVQRRYVNRFCTQLGRAVWIVSSFIERCPSDVGHSSTYVRMVWTFLSHDHVRKALVQSLNNVYLVLCMLECSAPVGFTCLLLAYLLGVVISVHVWYCPVQPSPCRQTLFYELFHFLVFIMLLIMRKYSSLCECVDCERWVWVWGVGVSVGSGC